ncbi:GDSL-type esterase/lipase family protein [Steroidobacter flavus]|uniref:GDSL-type esterase/lipase family protein n=1 Tax=Steroidobacter flavus TaxID=1842136 RepID=A0ABV8T5E9_9GAMM
MTSLLIPPRDGVDIGDYTLRDFAAKWMMQQCDLAEVAVYREANRALLAGSDRRKRVVFIGDSITEFWTGLAERQSESVAVINRGIRGQNSSQMLLRFEDDAIALQPACIVLLCGSNDLRSYVGAASSVAESARERIVRNVTAMADIAQARGIAMCLGALPPVNPAHPVHRDSSAIIAINGWLAEFAAARRLDFIDYHRVLVDAEGHLDAAFSEDGLHPNTAGYARMAQALQTCATVSALI